MKVVITSLLLVVGVFLIACGPSQAERNAQATQIVDNIFATRTAEAPPVTPTATPTVKPPTATPTPVPPTATPIPIIAQAEATFSGPMEVSRSGKNANAVSGEIEFVTSADGAAIVSLSYSLVEGKCTYVSDSSTTTISGSFNSTLHFNKPVPITDGKFTIDFMGIRARGNLNSPYEATGEITINIEETIQLPPSVLKKFTCDYGTWTWTADVIPSPTAATASTTAPAPTATPTPTRIATATPTATPPPVPDAQVQANTLNLRSGPGTDYAIVDTLRLGDSLQVIGRYGSDCSWLEVITPTGLQGWVAGTAQYVVLNRTCADIPLGEVRPVTGLIDRYVSRSGLGKLLIKNGTDADGVVVLTTVNDAPVMAAYIRSGESYRMTSIADGVYRLFFSKGRKWDSEEKAFTEQVSRQRFADTFSFSTTATTYSTWEVTLYGVVGGTAGSVNVPPAQFPKLP